MILKGAQRAGAGNLSRHLLNKRDNDHVTTLELRGFVSGDLTGALQEIQAVAKATKCKQFMFALSLNPPKEAEVREAAFIAAADKAEKELGLTGQPRAIIMHEKNGRRHAHVVWSRIDGNNLKAINLPFSKNKLTALSKELYLEHGWRLPDGLKTHGGKSPLSFSREEWQQAQRQKLDPREIKAVLQDAWERSDSLKGLGNALAERGYFIAKGDRRGFVAVDVNGEVYSLSKWIGVRTKELNEKLGKPDSLEAVADVKKAIRARVTPLLKAFIDQVKSKQAQERAPLDEERTRLVAAQRHERAQLEAKQKARWDKETQIRSERYRKGLMGLVDVLTGRARNIRKENEVEALRGLNRDRQQRDDLALAQNRERQDLQKRLEQLQSKHLRDRQTLARDVTGYLRRLERGSPDARRSVDRSHERQPPQPTPPTPTRKRGPDFSI